MDTELKLISSMATKDILAKLAAAYANETGRRVRLESIGGVDAVRRIRDGEQFDVALLAMSVVEDLVNEGIIARDSVRAFATSRTAVAVRAGSHRPSLGDETAVRDLIENARSVGLSTGPSGASIVTLLQRWGIYGKTKDRIVQAPPAVPVARLVDSGEVEVGFQQLSELMGHPGIEIIGTLPDSLVPITVFASGIRSATPNAARATELARYLSSDSTAAVKQQHGMDPA